ncbi:hypothetical protein [Litorimonas sp.]|uniref:hypothetical protein n=1 Tax=Litorimonas sp. TaxID=1892381 RepID=UPI003A84C60B
MDDKQLRLEAIRLAKGDISKAESIVNYVEQGWLENRSPLEAAIGQIAVQGRD